MEVLTHKTDCPQWKTLVCLKRYRTTGYKGQSHLPLKSSAAQTTCAKGFQHAQAMLLECYTLKNRSSILLALSFFLFAQRKLPMCFRSKSWKAIIAVVDD